LVLASCAETFNIQGVSNISTLDGRIVNLKILKDNDFKSLDSCDVLHGKFQFTGSVDSVCMASLFMDDDFVMPLVLENGDIKINLNDTKQSVEGTPLNDELFRFFNRYNQLQNQQLELVHRHDQAIMNGNDMNVVNAQLNQEAIKLSAQMDSLVTASVVENFDNVLGPGIFFMATASNRFPELTPWIEDIMSKATDKFKNDPYVKDYYSKAQENQRIMNGMQDAPAVTPTPSPAPIQPAPTPNELAQPANK